MCPGHTLTDNVTIGHVITAAYTACNVMRMHIYTIYINYHMYTDTIVHILWLVF